MKNLQSFAQTQLDRRKLWRHSRDQTPTQQQRIILVSLMVPFMLVVLDLTMFSVALPSIRNYFQIRADVAGWIVTAYSLPFMIAMPLYGRLGDNLGKRRLLLVGIATFTAGTVITLLSPNLHFLMAGRIIQGLGAASVVPLAIAIIAHRFPSSERGKALGTWNSIGPVIRIASPFLAGLLIDYLGWRVIFIPVVLIGIVAWWVVKEKIPYSQMRAKLNVLGTFDWGGLITLTAAVTSLSFYLSSPSITGVPALKDWRLLALAAFFFSIFIYWEKRHPNPYISLNLFTHKMFSLASFTAAIRMFAMSGIGFLLPLYLADVYNFNASAIGVVFMIHAAALLVTMRAGGQLADRYASSRPVTISMVVLVGVMLSLALLPFETPIWLINVIVAIHGLGAGLSLAALHRSSMDNISPEQGGIAAGLYSMVRFTGTLFGPVIGGVMLQYGLDTFSQPIQAYQMVFGLIAGVTVLGVVSGLWLQD